jgi:hypothetical protein
MPPPRLAAALVALALPPFALGLVSWAARSGGAPGLAAGVAGLFLLLAAVAQLARSRAPRAVPLRRCDDAGWERWWRRWPQARGGPPSAPASSGCQRLKCPRCCGVSAPGG